MRCSAVDVSKFLGSSTRPACTIEKSRSRSSNVMTIDMGGEGEMGGEEERREEGGEEEKGGRGEECAPSSHKQWPPHTTEQSSNATGP